MDVIAARVEARDSNVPLVVDVPDVPGGRLVAEFYRLAHGGLVFLDSAWAGPTNPRGTEHRLPEAEGSFIWPAGGFAIRTIIPSVEPEVVEEWDLWRAIRAHMNAGRPDGRVYVDEAASG